MIPNNKYYKDIAVILGYEWDNRHHSSLVYMKEIAMAYGFTYSSTKPSNKFLKDWHTGLTGETPSDHKYNLWYLREIAEFLGSSTGLNENQCLAYIKDNIENPPTPSQFDSIALTVTTPILSYADADSTSLTAQLMNGQEEVHLSGKSVSFDIVDSDGDVIANIGSDDTDSDGIATVSYSATGVGDITIQASVTNSSDTYTDTEDVEDCWRYYPNNITSSLTTNWNLPNNCTIDFEAYNSKTGMGQAWHPILGTDNSHRVVLGSIQDATKYQMWVNDNNATSVKTTSTISLPTGWHEEQIKVENGTVTFHDLSVTPSNIDLTNLWNLSIYQSSAQFRNIKIKPIHPITVSATKDTIVSSETTTMTATLPSLESGKSIKIYQDGILVDTKQTDSQGQVTYTYTGQGVGDVSFEFKSGYWSGIKTIEDYTKIYTLDSSTQYKTNSGSYGSTVIANGVYSGGASFLSETFDGSQGDWTVKMDIMFTGSNCGVGLQYGVVHNRERSIFKINNGGGCGYSNSPNGWYGLGGFGISNNIWYPVTFEKKGNTITCYCNNLNFSTSAWEFTNSATLSVGTDQWLGSGSPASFRNLRIHLE